MSIYCIPPDQPRVWSRLAASWGDWTSWILKKEVSQSFGAEELFAGKLGKNLTGKDFSQP